MIYKYLNIDIKYMDTCMHVRVCVNIQVYKDCAWIFVEMKREIKKKKKKGAEEDKPISGYNEIGRQLKNCGR